MGEPSNHDDIPQTGALDMPSAAPLPEAVEEIVAEARELSRGNRSDPMTTDAYWDRVHALYEHADREAVVERALALCAAKKARDRELGVDVCAQLPAAIDDEAAGEALRHRLREAVRPRLADSSKDVRASAVHAIGHLGIRGFEDEVLPHASAAQPELRFAVACVLGSSDDPRAIDALVELSADEDADVRDWACMGLGTQHEEIDTPALREALWARIDDPHPDVRAEAQLGLALRGDRRVLAHLALALAHEEVGNLSIEAAIALPSRSLLPALEQLATWWPERDALDAAIEACEAAHDG